jgi:hypothetical protein
LTGENTNVAEKVRPWRGKYGEFDAADDFKGAGMGTVERWCGGVHRIKCLVDLHRVISCMRNGGAI